MKHIAKSSLKSSGIISPLYITRELLEAMVQNVHSDPRFIMKPSKYYGSMLCGLTRWLPHLSSGPMWL